jgi:hypothetical protein
VKTVLKSAKEVVSVAMTASVAASVVVGAAVVMTGASVVRSEARRGAVVVETRVLDTMRRLGATTGDVARLL